MANNLSTVNGGLKFKHLLLAFAISGVSCTQCCMGEDRLPLMVKKNINEVTTFFNDEISDRHNLEANMQQEALQGIERLKNGEATELLKGGENLEDQARTLGNMNLNEAENKGFEVKAEDNELWNKAFINYNDPLIKMHKEDVDEIAKATEKLKGKMSEMYEKLGIDCKQLKGPEDIEPELYIEIDRVPEKEVTYDKYMCEQLRNTYSCGDTLTMRCNVKGIEWGPWQDKKIIVPGDELVDYQNDLMTSDYVARETFEYKLFIGEVKFRNILIKPRPELVDRARIYLATKHEGATKDNIDIIMRAEWGGGIYSIQGRVYAGDPCGHKAYAHKFYHIYYRYRDGKPACLSWSEEWSEKCTLK